MPERKQEEQEFTVVDRRPFTPEGERRTDVPLPEPSPPEPPPRPQAPREPAGARAPKSPASAAAAPPGPSEAGQGAVQFEHLIMSLVTSAMLQLGMAGRPDEVPPPPDFVAAQETIDLLGLLQQKTRGNLTPGEEEILTGSLSELRLAFVELSRRAGRVR